MKNKEREEENVERNGIYNVLIHHNSNKDYSDDLRNGIY